METDRLLHFKTVVDSGGLLKASEFLGISGGGLSKSLKTLEYEIGQKLFVQKGRGLELTEDGQRFYEKLPEFFKALEALKPTSSHLAGTNEVLRFATFEVFSTFFLADFISQNLSQETVEIREALPGEMEKLIAEGRSDIGITYEPIPTKGLEFLKISQIKMAAFANRSLSSKEMDIEEIPFAVPLSPIMGTPTGVKGLDGWPEHLVSRRDLYRVEMLQTAIELAANGKAAVFIPKFIADLHNAKVNKAQQLIELPLPSKVGTIKRHAYIILRRESQETSVVKKLARSLRGLE